LQTRSQAEDIIYGETNNGFHNFGDSGLPADQSASNQDAVGSERDSSDPLNVIVSGWKVYNNKGEVVQQYEPFFDQGFDYKRPSDSQKGQITEMFYDPRGQVVKTINPDDTEQRVIFGIPRSLSTPDQYDPTPWESYTYDPNDLGGETHNTESDPYKHLRNTPTSSESDALGRTVKTIEHQAHLDNPHDTPKFNDPNADYDDVVMEYTFDIRGNLTEVTDAKDRKAFEYTYSLRPTKKDEQGEVIESYQIDSGTSTVIYNANGQPVEQNDAKGSFALHAYDALGRPTHVWAKDLSGEDVTLRQRMEYGESQSNPKTNNLLGKLYHQFDEAGVETVTSYDFKGNPLTKQRKVISDSEILNVFNNATSDWDVPTYRVDWSGKDETSSILDSFVYQTDMEYDALDRVTKMTYPEDVNGNRKVMTPTYNKGGNLQKVDFDGTEYVKEIAYNARGQRLLIAFGNDIMTRYIYDNKTFRLFRQKSEKYTYSFNSTDNTHTYSPQSGTTRQDYAYEYDLVANILKLKDRTPNSGIDNTTLGTDALDREFDYDPLYRLANTTGRK
jgi:hypothetical protein